MDGEFAQAFRDRSGLSPELYSRAFLLLGETFLLSCREIEKVRTLAREIKTAMGKVGPLIQQTTAAVCPNCAEVCCISKHGFYNYEDLVYLFALGLRPPSIDFHRQDSDPCQFLTPDGCSMDRSVRPSGCNWYFCDPLLEEIEGSEDYHEFDESIKDLAELWMKMIDEFSKLSPRRPA